MTRTLRRLFRFGTVSLVGLLLTKEAKGQQVSTNLSIKDKYVGTPGFVFEREPVIQPSLSVSGRGFYGTLGSNFKRAGISEIDYFIGYKTSTSGLDFDVSYGLFDLKNAGKNRLNDNLYELWLKISKRGKLSPSVTLIQNFSGGTLENSKGNYAILALNYRGWVGEIPVSLDGIIQYNNKYFIGERGFSIAQANLSLPFKTRNIMISPQIRLRRALDKSNFEDSTDFGLALGFHFHIR